MHTQRQLNKGAEDSLILPFPNFGMLDFTVLIMALFNKVFGLVKNIITYFHMLLSKIYISEVELCAQASQNHQKFLFNVEVLQIAIFQTHIQQERIKDCLVRLLH